MAGNNLLPVIIATVLAGLVWTIAQKGSSTTTPPPQSANLVITGVSYSPSNPGQCQQVKAMVTIKNTGGMGAVTKLSGVTLLSSNPASVQGNWFGTPRANLDGESNKGKLITIAAGAQVTMDMYNAGTGVGYPMDVRWELTWDNQKISRYDIKALIPTFSGYLSHCSPWW